MKTRKRKYMRVSAETIYTEIAYNYAKHSYPVVDFLCNMVKGYNLDVDIEKAKEYGEEFRLVLYSNVENS